MCVGVVLLVGSVAFRRGRGSGARALPAQHRRDHALHRNGDDVRGSATLLPLATPKVEPLSLSRHVKVVDGDYGQAVVRETVTIKAGPTTSVEKYQYVMDRRSMKFVEGSAPVRVWDPSATIHAAGAYRINFAMGTNEDGKYLSYIPEADASVPLVLTEDRHHHSDANIEVWTSPARWTSRSRPTTGLTSRRWPADAGDRGATPRTARRRRHQRRTPRSPMCAPADSPDESKLLADTLTKPMPLKYFFEVGG